MNNSFTREFKQAINDYLFLLEKKYSEKAILKIVQDRYRLNGIERSILQRGVIAKEVALNRRLKIVNEDELSDKTLLVDFFNIILTIYSYLNGILIYFAMDGLIRDVSESHGKFRKNKNLYFAIDIIFKYLNNTLLKNVIFYIDSPVSKSKEISYLVFNKIKEYKLNAEVELVKSADFYLVKGKNNICATSDSKIIDKIDKVFDLAHYILKNNYNPIILDIYKIIE
jgi:hypothetical protein